MPSVSLEIDAYLIIQQLLINFDKILQDCQFSNLLFRKDNYNQCWVLEKQNTTILRNNMVKVRKKSIRIAKNSII